VESAGKGIVAAGIQNEDIEAVFGRFHLGRHFADLQSLELDVLFLLHLSAYRSQIIDSIDLQAVAGEIEQADAAGFDLLSEGAHGGKSLSAYEADTDSGYDARI
jgi:hypothetical protein